MVTKLDTWLENNKGNSLGYAKYVGTPISDDRLCNFLESHEMMDVDMNVINWLSAMVKQSYKGTHDTKNKRKVFCSELVAHFLQEMGVLVSKYKPSGYKPYELLYGKLDLIDPNSYAKPILIH
jgi:hypothetical protein